MPQNMDNSISESTVAIHQYYMDIINSMPNIVYWIDVNCELKGSNNNFVSLLNLKGLRDFVGTPYELLHKHAHWSFERVDDLRLDDMKVIFSGKATCSISEPPIYDKQNNPLNFISNRTPLFDHQKHVIGLVVVLTDITQNKSIDKDNSDASLDNFLKPGIDRVPRVLMVEDNLIAQKVEQSLISAMGCDVEMAESGERAVSLFSPGKYDLVFMDIGLQDTSGYIVAKKLREKEKGTNYHVPIIALTSYEADIVKHDCRDYFMDGVITKPLSMEQAKQIIQHYVYNQDILVKGLELE